MNIKLLSFAAEQLHRDPDIFHQETRTAVRKFFADRNNIDDLLTIVQSHSMMALSEFRKEMIKRVVDLQLEEAKLRSYIDDLESELRRVNQKLRFTEMDNQARQTKPRHVGDIDRDDPINSSGKRASTPKTVRVWTRGVNAAS